MYLVNLNVDDVVSVAFCSESLEFIQEIINTHFSKGKSCDDIVVVEVESLED